MTDKPLLVRLDRGHDAGENRAWLSDEGVDFLIKWNPRQQDLTSWVQRTGQHAEWLSSREGKCVALSSEAVEEEYLGKRRTFLDIERLPSGKFDNNDLILSKTILSYNILRRIGLIGLTGELSPVRHPAKRRWLRTVMQELMYLAARFIDSGWRLRLRFSRH